MVMCARARRGLRYGLMITASHNPYMYNGVKLFVRGGADADVAVTRRLETFTRNVKNVRALSDAQFYGSPLVKAFCNRREYLSHIEDFLDPSIEDNRLHLLFDNLFGVAGGGFEAAVRPLQTQKVRHSPCGAGCAVRQPPAQSHAADDCAVAGGGDAREVPTTPMAGRDGDRLGILDEQGKLCGQQRHPRLPLLYLVRYRGMKGDAVKNIATSVLLDLLAERLGVCLPHGWMWVQEHLSDAGDDALIGGESSGGLTCRGYLAGKDSTFSGALFMEMRIKMDKPVSEIVKEVHAFCGYTYACVRTNFAFPLCRRRGAFARLTPDFGREVVRLRATEQ